MRVSWLAATLKRYVNDAANLQVFFANFCQFLQYFSSFFTCAETAANSFKKPATVHWENTPAVTTLCRLQWRGRGTLYRVVPSSFQYGDVLCVKILEQVKNTPHFQRVWICCRLDQARSNQINRICPYVTTKTPQNMKHLATSAQFKSLLKTVLLSS